MRVYTDGASSKNGDGGWSFVNLGTLRYGVGWTHNTTNQRMELQAALGALRVFRGKNVNLTIVSDSAYLVNCFLDGWWEKWIANDWHTSSGRVVKNSDLWKPIISITRRFPIDFEHVRGHSGDPGNELADRLAVQAKHEKITKSGQLSQYAYDPRELRNV